MNWGGSGQLQLAAISVCMCVCAVVVESVVELVTILIRSSMSSSVSSLWLCPISRNWQYDGREKVTSVVVCCLFSWCATSGRYNCNNISSSSSSSRDGEFVTVGSSSLFFPGKQTNRFFVGQKQAVINQPLSLSFLLPLSRGDQLIN